MGLRDFFKRKKYYTEEMDVGKKSKRDRIKEKLDVQKASKGTVEEADTWGISADYVPRTIKGNLSAYDLWTYYLSDSWIRACVDKIVKEVVKYTPTIVPKETGEEISDETWEHVAEVQELLDNPNDKIESFDDIRRKYLRDILIYDASAVEIVKGEESGKPRELYDLCGPDIVLNVDEHGNFKKDKEGKDLPAYKLKSLKKSAGEWPKFNKDEVIYMMQYPQAGSIYGLSPIETLWVEIDNDIEAAEFNSKILKHSGMLSGVLAFPGMANDKLKKNKIYWEREIKRKGQKLIVTNNPDVKFIKLSESQKDMQFLEYQKWLLNKIMAVYGMQPIVLGVIDPTTGKLNSKEQREQFKQDAVLPLLKLEAHRFTDVLLRQAFGYDDIEFAHEDPAVEIDEEFQLDKVVKLGKLGVILIDEAREMVGLEPLPDNQGQVLISTGKLAQLVESVEKSDEKDKIEEIRNRINELIAEESIE